MCGDYIIGDNTHMTDTRPPLTPRFWPSWLIVGLMWLLGKTPQWFGLAISAPLGWLLLRLVPRRRHIAERNIARCFPELTAEQRSGMLKQNFKALARMVFEVCWSWSAPAKRIQRMYRMEGVEHVRQVQAGDKGVMYITAHVTPLEIGGRIAGIEIPQAKGVYRPLENPVIEWYQNRGRKRYVAGSISKRDLRGIIRFLKNSGELWYAPDQDFGPVRSAFAPFFGIETASLEASVRLVEMSGCRVVPMYPVYDEESRTYIVKFDAPLENFPSGNLREDLARINRVFEEKIRKAPEQYWWIHRRFKTRPEGEPPFYE